jgi:hypothetical protein
LLRQCPNADRSVYCAAQGRHGICQRSKDHRRRVGHTRILRHPHPTPGRSQVEMISGRVRGVRRQRGNPACHQPIVRRQHRGRTQLLPGQGRGDRRLRLRSSRISSPSPFCPPSRVPGARPCLPPARPPSPLSKKPVCLGHPRRLPCKAPCPILATSFCRKGGRPQNTTGTGFTRSRQPANLCALRPHRHRARDHKDRNRHRSQRQGRPSAAQSAVPGCGNTQLNPAPRARLTGYPFKSPHSRTRPESDSGLPSLHPLRGT